jgi:hypothetical protein
MKKKTVKPEMTPLSLSISNRQWHNFWMPISELVATVFAVDFWIGSDTVKPNKNYVGPIYPMGEL